jgi:DNA ligase 4
VSSARGKKKTEVTQLFFDNYAFKEDRSSQYTYTLLRLILPFYDRERGVYKLQEKAIARLFHNALGLPEPEY